MSDTKIEWADAVWNPVTGCTPVSAGCQHCYARRMATRLAGRCGYPAAEPFRVTLHPDKGYEPVRWRKPRRIFVCSMGDLFHDAVPQSYIHTVLHVVRTCLLHTFMLLTKRPERAARIDWTCASYGEDYRSLPNLWLGTSVEDQATADERIPHLLRCPAAVRFVSAEPLLGPIDLADAVVKRQLGDPQPNWVIAGGETGPGARPAHPDWFRSLRDQCQAASVPFFFKQHGEWAPLIWFDGPDADEREPEEAIDLERDPHIFLANDGRAWDTCGGRYMYPPIPLGHWCLMHRPGKKAAGHLLDGREWREVPEPKGGE
jgi:protein gp37